MGKAPNGDYLVTSRNLDLVVALSADGSGVAWTLAADPASVGARYASLELRDASGAPSDRAKFYQPHAVSMPADDRLLLVDDGRFRANCSSAAVCKSTTGLGGPHQTSELSISAKSKSIRLIFGRIDCSHRVLEAQPKALRRNGRIRAH